MKVRLLILFNLFCFYCFSEAGIHYIYEDINNSKNIFKVTAVKCNKDSVTFKIDSVLLGNKSDSHFTLSQREIKYLLYGCVYAPAIKLGEERIIFLKSTLNDTTNQFKLLLDLKLQNGSIYLPNTVDVGVENERRILPKNPNSFFDAILSLNQLYEAIRIINLCNNVDGKSTNKNIKCDDIKLDEIAKNNLVIRGWQLSKLDEYQRLKKKF